MSTMPLVSLSTVLGVVITVYLPSFVVSCITIVRRLMLVSSATKTVALQAGSPILLCFFSRLGCSHGCTVSGCGYLYFFIPSLSLAGHVLWGLVEDSCGHVR